MENVFNVNYSEGLSKACYTKGLKTFDAVCNYIKGLPYGRNSDRSNYNLVLLENKGTCSTKHAFLKQIAIENNQHDVMLCIGIYKMNETNTNGVGSVLKYYNLEYIPEAHTYLKIKHSILDVTRTVTSEITFEKSLLKEVYIMPKQIGDYKVNLHKAFLENWIKMHHIPYTLTELWHIRERCIAALNQ
ncbi:hypothetical protein [Pontimicrobium sp. MEBiC01747]